MKTDEAFEMLRKMQEPEAWEPQISEKAFDALEMAIDALALMRWIPCSKRLPEKIEKNYWICTDFGYQCPCKWKKYPSKRGDFWTWHLNAHVVAWMPLPKPYTEEQE